MKVYILQTPVDPFDPSRGMDEREVYMPYAVLRNQYAFAHINEEVPEDDFDTTRWRIKPAGSNPPIYAYSWPKPE